MKVTRGSFMQKYSESAFYVIIALLPFHGFLSVWMTSIFGYGLVIRSWKEILLVPVVAWLIWRLSQKDEVVLTVLKSKMARMVMLYIAYIVSYFLLFSISHHKVTTAGLVGLATDARFFVFFLTAIIVFNQAGDKALSRRILKKVVAIPALLTATIALLQVTILPKDILSHFGFVKPKYQPVLYIDQDNIYLRARSTLRGPNELGAYLITPLLLFWGLIKTKRWIRCMVSGLLIGAIVVSYSRSAALGLIVAAGLLYSRPLLGYIRRHLQSTFTKTLAISVILVVVVAGIFAAQTNTFSTLFLHNNRNNNTAGSTDTRISNVGTLFRDSFKHPFGSGLGASGPASLYGTPNIPDNYYVQIIQEVGFIGLVLFLVAIYLIWRELRGSNAPEARILAACLVGLMISNIFLHNWADDTLSMYFFGLAGWSLGMTHKKVRTKSENPAKIA